MRARLEALQAGPDAPASATPDRPATDADQQPGDEAQPDPAADDVQPEDGAEKAEKGKKDPDRVSMKVFKQRLAEEGEKRKALQATVAQKDLALSQQREALELLAREFQSLRQRLADAGQLDERDDELSALRLEREASATRERIAREHQERIAKQADAARMAEVKQQITQEFEQALEACDLVREGELRAAWRAAMDANPKATALEVAEKLQAQKLEKLRGRVAPPQPPTPTTVKPSAAPTSYRYSNDARGMLAFLRANGGGG